MSFIIPNIILTEVKNKGRIFPCDTFNIILKKKKIGDHTGDFYHTGGHTILL